MMTTQALILVALQLASPADLQALLDDLVSTQDVPGISATVTREDRVLFSGGTGVDACSGGTGADVITSCE